MQIIIDNRKKRIFRELSSKGLPRLKRLQLKKELRKIKLEEISG